MGDHEAGPDWFDQSAQSDPAWVAWRAQIPEKIERLFTETLPRVPTGTQDGWRYQDSRPTEPMPSVDRFRREASDWVGEAFEWFFPTEDSLFDKAFDGGDGAELFDQFVCYLGEVLVTRAGGQWVNLARRNEAGDLVDASELHEQFTPGIAYDDRLGEFTPPDDVARILFAVCTSDGEPDFAMNVDSEVVYPRERAYAAAHGLADDWYAAAHA